MLDIVILIIATICSFFISALAWLIDTICSACMTAFLPGVWDGHIGIEHWWELMGVSDEMNQYFPFLRGANRVFMFFALTMIAILFMFNILKNFQPGIRREGLFAQVYRAILAVVLVALSYQLIGGAMALGYNAINAMKETNISVEAYDLRIDRDKWGDENQSDAEWEATRNERIAAVKTFKYNRTMNTEDLHAVNIGTVYEMVTHEALVEMIYDNESDLDDTAGMAVVVILPLIIMVAIAWNSVKLFIEMSERLVATTLITSLAPLGFCTVVTEETEGILRRYLSMVFSTYLVYIIDIWFMRAFIYCSYTYLVQYVWDVHIGMAKYIPTGFIWFLVLQLAWLICAQKADQYLRDAGLSVAQTGGKLLGELALAGRTITGSMRAASKLGSNAHKHFNKLNNDSKLGKHHNIAGGAERVMKNAMGKDAYNAMKKAGFVPTRASDWAEAVMKNGKATGELRGKYTNDKGQAIHWKTCNSPQDAANRGHACYVNPVNGQCFEVWSNDGKNGERSLFAPNDTSMSEFGTAKFDGAENAARDYLSQNNINKDTIGEAGELYRKELCGGDEALMAESKAAAERLLPNDDAYKGLTPIAAGFDSEDAADVSHLTCINEDGRIVNFDITTGNVDDDSLFNDRSIKDEVNGISGFSYKDGAGREVTAMVQSNVSEDEFIDYMRNNGTTVKGVQALSDGSIKYKTYDNNGKEVNCRWFSSARHTQYGDGNSRVQYINGQAGRVEVLTGDGVSKHTRRHSQKKVFTKMRDRSQR